MAVKRVPRFDSYRRHEDGDSWNLTSEQALIVGRGGVNSGAVIINYCPDLGTAC
jgi:hypothetical protein